MITQFHRYRAFLSLVAALVFFVSPRGMAAPVAGVDFSTGDLNSPTGTYDPSTEDLNLADGITVTNWGTSQDGGISGDGNGNAGRASAPVGKFNGPSVSGIPPAVGSSAPTEGVHFFSIDIDATTTVNLTRVAFDFSKATGSGNVRWLAFRTSLNPTLIYSSVGPARPTLESVDLTLTGPEYEGLTNQTVTFYWYSGGEGSGDCDIDSIVIEAEEAASSPPTVVTLAASEIEATTAELNGEVTETGGADPSITFFYGTSDGGTIPGAWEHSVDIGNEASVFSTEISGLTPETQYFYRAFAQNSGGPAWAAASVSFTTAAILPPAITNTSATNVTGTAAKVGGEVTESGGDPPVVTLFWGDNDGGTNAGSWDNSVDLGIRSGGFSSELTGLNPLTTYYFRSRAVNGGAEVWTSSTETFTTLEVQNLVINEFMAANDGGQSNNDNGWYPIPNQVPGATEDWIEISNRSGTALPLDGWFLTDDPDTPTQWAFPAGTMVPANGFLLVYASGDGVPDANGNLHANFRLSKGGEYLALVDSSLSVVSEFGPAGSDYPGQDDDVSYGLHPVDDRSVYFGSPTPGAVNDAAGLARVADTKFSLKRGYYQTAIDVALTTATSGATIYYTTDGSLPIDDSGSPGATALVYGAPISIMQTTAIRAAAVKEGFAPTNVDCNTYILLDIDNANPDGTDAAGLNLPFLQQTQPPGWGNLSSGDFNMDPNVSQATSTATGHTTSTAQTMLEGMRDIPTFSVVMNRDDFSGGNGIYSNSENKGFDWERAISAEFIPAAIDSRDDWQENCGLRVQGGASRNRGSSPKHSLSFRFREEYGASKLREPLFPGSSVDEYNVVALRAGYNNSWIHRDSGQRGRGSMIRDQWARQSMLDMGNPAAGEGFMAHLFVNGLYWGVHNVCERGDASHYAEHNGGDADLLDAKNGSEFVDGNSTAFDQIDDVVNTGDWAKIQQVINIDQYIDYQLINRYGGNADLKTNGNWRAAGGGPFPVGQPELMAPWDLYSWDAERTLESPTASNVPLDPLNIRGALEANPDYMLRLADRVQKHFYGDGALTPTATAARWEKYANDLDRAIIAESARWGDHRESTPYTRDGAWLTEQNRLYTSYFPVRTNNVLNDLTLPSVGAPAFQVGGLAQSDGLIPLGANLTVTGSGTIYFTTDGSDPRLDGGAVNPSSSSVSSGGTIPLTVGSLVKARVLSGPTWSALSEGTFYVGPIATSANLVISEIMYNPAGPEEDTEFVEIMNVDSSNALDLSDSTFEGIDYTFPLGTSLPAGGRMVIVKDPVAFAAVYNTVGMLFAPGDYGSSLSNDGEEIAFINSVGTDVQRFTYNDVSPWPVSADGDGYTLTLISPDSLPDHSLPESWRNSAFLLGSPGASDAEVFSGNPDEDLDGDGLSAFLEYAMGSTAGDSGFSPESLIKTGTAFFDDGIEGFREFLTVSYRRNLRADDVLFEIEISNDLVLWDVSEAVLVGAVANGDGTETVTVRSTTPVADDPSQYARLKVSSRP